MSPLNAGRPASLFEGRFPKSAVPQMFSFRRLAYNKITGASKVHNQNPNPVPS